MKCFVIMPFGMDNSEKIYSQWIKPAVEEVPIEKVIISCHRADKSLRPDEIITHVVMNIAECDIVIADLTGKNSNVFYELGVRHALSNNTILIAQGMDDVPFDLRTQRVILYTFDMDGMVKLKNDLRESIRSILQDPETIDNPVRKYLYDKEIRKFFKSGLPGFNAIETLVNEVALLKSSFSQQLTELTSIIEGVVGEKTNTSTLSKIEPNIDIEELRNFEGAWYDMNIRSHFYAKIVNDKILVPYCYGGNDNLTAHYYDLHLFNKTLFGRFSWMNSTIYGFVFLTVFNNDTLKGSWWYSHDMPPELRNLDFTKDGSMNQPFWNESIKNMNRLVLTRKKGVTPKYYPEWVNDYFNCPDKYQYKSVIKPL